MNSFVDRVLNRLGYQLHQWSERADEFLYDRQFRRHEYQGLGAIPTWTSLRELEALYNIAALQPPHANALEIGSYLGASTCYLAAGLARAEGHLFCVDTWMNETMEEGERDTFAEFQKNTQSFRSYITPIRKMSRDLNAADFRLPLHLVFIDGDHSYAAVKCDFELVAPWVASDGTVAFHDYGVHHFGGVSRVVAEALVTGEWKVSGVVDNLLWINPIVEQG